VKATRAGGNTKASSGLIARAISTGCHSCLDGLERRDEGGEAQMEASILSHGAGLRPSKKGLDSGGQDPNPFLPSSKHQSQQAWLSLRKAG
jgi:hypothetical protein